MFEKIPDIMTFKECQKLLKVGKNTLLDLIHSGEQVEDYQGQYRGVSETQVIIKKCHANLKQHDTSF